MAAPVSLPAAQEGSALIRVRSVSKFYGGAKVLDEVSMDVRSGEVRCIIGPSGSGKSTLLRCLNARRASTAAPSWLAIHVSATQSVTAGCFPGPLARLQPFAAVSVSFHSM